LAPTADPNLLYGNGRGDDTGVYKLADGLAIVQTVDFFTPIVDDPYDFGRIGAANALSDLYAMGARPLFGLNLVGFPRKLLGDGILERILEGGGEICREAGIPVLGGHSIDDAEPKFGMVAVGDVHPDCLVTNASARVGDVLVLTKPLGSGIVATAIKEGAAPEDVIRIAVDTMTALNKGASEALGCVGAHAATDVTGFGLLGHLRNMLRASGVAAVVHADDVPLLPGVMPLIEAGHIPAGSARNLMDLAEDVAWNADVPTHIRTVLTDAQTSGGLLISVPADGAEELLEELQGKVIVAAVVGRIVEGPAGSIQVL